MGGLLVESLALALRKIPFTCVYVPGSANLRAWWPVYLFVFTTYCFTMAGVARTIIASPLAAAVFFTAAIAAWAALHAWRTRAADALERFVYDEEPEGVRSVVT
jgi:hypothetical protein